MVPPFTAHPPPPHAPSLWVAPLKLHIRMRKAAAPMSCTLPQGHPPMPSMICTAAELVPSAQVSFFEQKGRKFKAFFGKDEKKNLKNFQTFLNFIRKLYLFYFLV